VQREFYGSSNSSDGKGEGWSVVNCIVEPWAVDAMCRGKKKAHKRKLWRKKGQKRGKPKEDEADQNVRAGRPNSTQGTKMGKTF